MKAKELKMTLSRLGKGVNDSHLKSLICSVIERKIEELDVEVTSLRVIAYKSEYSSYRQCEIVGNDMSDNAIMERIKSICDGFDWYDTVIEYDTTINVYLGDGGSKMYKGSELLVHLREMKKYECSNIRTARVLDSLIAGVSLFTDSFISQINFIEIPNCSIGVSRNLVFKDEHSSFPNIKTIERIGGGLMSDSQLYADIVAELIMD